MPDDCNYPQTPRSNALSFHHSKGDSSYETFVYVNIEYYYRYVLIVG